MTSSVHRHPIQVICKRLVRGDDLKHEIERLVVDKDICGGYIMTCVGSVSRATIRLATPYVGKEEIRTLNQNMEITSLVGTLSPDGCHLHISLADETGAMIGGHLMLNTVVQTTVELVVAKLFEIKFNRQMDDDTGYNELVIGQRCCTIM